MSSAITNEELDCFFRAIFDCALHDINSINKTDKILAEPKDVSFLSFQKYMLNNHRQILKAECFRGFAMELYKKAIEDIAFQADEHYLSLRDIPIQIQQLGCETAIERFQIHLAEQMPSVEQQGVAVE